MCEGFWVCCRVADPWGLVCNPHWSAAVNRSLLTAVLVRGDRSLQEDTFLE